MSRFHSAMAVALCAVGANFFAPAQEADSVDRDYAAELPRTQPLEPREALASFQIHPGFHMELVAAEPLVFDPIAMAFDESGRLFVVEMRGYSERRADLIGAIRLLTDADGDGVFDSSTVFADGLAWPTAVACYDGGIFVAEPPDILYLKDTDGDEKADTREVVFSGFGLNNVQGLLNSFNWGLDNLIHGATSSSGATVTSAKYPNEAPLVLRGRDFAIDAKSLRMTAESGGAQHGLTFDDWGRKFVCHNSDHLIEIMFEDRYLARNPFYSAPGPRNSIAGDGPQAEVFRISPDEPWRVVRTRLRVKGIVEGPVEGGGRASGYFTSATGVTVYRGDAYPAEYRGNVFVADVGSNLVHRKTLMRDGVAFHADRADPGVEFLASTDNWFRPVQFANGPDGCLYVADMYREVIEHPDSLPPVIKKHLDLNSGYDRGRIYRIVPDGFQQPTIPRLGEQPDEVLVPLLGHANAWHAETAQRLLYQRADAKAIPALEALARGTGPFTGRARALYTLQSLGALTEDVVRAGMGSADSRLRRQAIRLAENFASPSTQLVDTLSAWAADPDPELRFQVAFTIGTWDTPQRLARVLQIAESDGGDPWMTVALMTSLSTGAGTVAERLLGNADLIARADYAPLFNALGRQVGAAGDPEDAISLLHALEALPDARLDLRRALITAMLDGAREAGSGGRIRGVLSHSPAAKETLDGMVSESLRRADDSAASTPARLDAIQTLVFAPGDSVIPVLSRILNGPGDAELRAAAIGTLAQFDGPVFGVILIDSLGALPAALLTPALDAVFSRDSWVRRLLAAVESGAIGYGALPSTFRHRLQSHHDETIRAAAARLDVALAPPDLQAELARLSSVAEVPGRSDTGAAIFAERCAPCHRAHGIGETVGPELAGIREWDTPRLLLSIVNPNAEINPQYVAYSVETVDGRYLSGILESDTATGITLRMSGGAQTILKSQVRAAEAMDLSLMPENLTEGLDAQAVADLIAYLRAE